MTPEEQTCWDKLAAENAALRSTIDDLTAGDIHTCHDHCQRTACILRRENTALRSRLAEAEQWIRNHPPRFGGDHACAQCYPHSDVLVAGFVCAYHRATDSAPAALGELPMTWQRAALIAGEIVGDAGPVGYYSMSPQAWLDWFRATADQPEDAGNGR